MNATCPACGSTEIKTEINNSVLPEYYGKDVFYKEHIDCCLVCGERGDFSGVNDSMIEKALEKSKKQIINSMLEDLLDAGIKMSYLERTLDLPTRTVSRWKSGESSAASVALLRAIHAFPWILDVADANFDKKYANMKVLNEAVRIWHTELQPHVNNTAVGVVSSFQSLTFHAFVEINKSALVPRLEQAIAIGV